MSVQLIHGFSKLTRSEKITWLREQCGLSKNTMELLENHLHPDSALQRLYGEISENTISNFILPMGLAPNFLINGDLFTVPMVIEESSVVAAAAHAAKFWATRGGFRAEVLGMQKNGQVHFKWSGDPASLLRAFEQGKETLLRAIEPMTRNMEKRGGGIQDMEIRQAGTELPGIYQLFVTFLTADAMGANFINSVLEELAGKLPSVLESAGAGGTVEIIMSILSNYTPECLVRCIVESSTNEFDGIHPRMTGDTFARAFYQAVQIAMHDPYRAVTHNKGIFNGMDAVILATGNDYRAVEACGHAYASRNGSYTSLSRVELEGALFRFTLEVPLAVGTVGGLTGTHPLAEASLEILGNPSAQELMQIIAAAGMANNFSAIRSLVTTGIQHGHMKMHLANILRQLKATPEESARAQDHFRERAISHSDVSAYLGSIRNQKPQ
jgi:hydroxymethylglutaryl-CoA reductase